MTELTEAEQNRLINEHMSLVPVVAARFRGGQVEFDELVSVGGLGLTKAARSYDPAKSQFSTWATTKIESEIKMFLRPEPSEFYPKETDGPLPPLDSDKIEKIYEWDAWGDRGNAEAICERWSRLDSSPEDLSLLYASIKDMRHKFEAAFISLNGNQRRLVKWVFLNDQAMTIPEAARELGVSRFQAGRMLKRALKIMREVIIRMEENSGGNTANGHPSIAGLHGCAPGTVAA